MRADNTKEGVEAIEGERVAGARRLSENRIAYGENLICRDAMEVLASHEGIALMTASIVPHATPAGLPEGTPFVCLVWNHAADVHPDWTGNLARNLVRNGCQYFVCAGNQAEKLRDCIDESVSALDDEGRAPSSTSWRPGASPAMTSWHVDEEMEDIVFFFLTGTQEGDFEASNFLIIHVGEAGSPEEPREAAPLSAATGEEAAFRLKVDEVAGRLFLEELLAAETLE